MKFSPSTSKGWEEEIHLITVYRYFPRCILESSSFILIENSNIHDYLNKPERVSESHRLLAADLRDMYPPSKLRNLVFPRSGTKRQGRLKTFLFIPGTLRRRASFPWEIAPHHGYTCIYICPPDWYVYIYRIGKRERDRILVCSNPIFRFSKGMHFFSALPRSLSSIFSLRFGVSRSARTSPWYRHRELHNNVTV